MIVKPVNAGEKTMDEIKEMIKNLDDDTMISIDFTSLGMEADDAETYKIDPESRMLIKEEQPEFCNSGWSKEHNVTKELSKAIQKAYGIDL